jgi:hypothetical protein
MVLNSSIASRRANAALTCGCAAIVSPAGFSSRKIPPEKFRLKNLADCRLKTTCCILHQRRARKPGRQNAHKQEQVKEDANIT